MHLLPLQAELLLKLLEDEEEEASGSSGVKRSYPGRRDAKTVGCQVGGFSLSRERVAPLLQLMVALLSPSSDTLFIY